MVGRQASGPADGLPGSFNILGVIMSVSTFRPFVAEPSDETRILSAREQAELDRLYWDESEQPLRVSDIAGRFDLPANRVHRFVTPWPNARTCLLCASAAVCTSRSQRSSGALTCGGCGAPVRSRADRYSPYWDDGAPPVVAADVMAAEVDPVPVPHVLIRRRLGDRLRDLGNEASRAVSALERSGRPFADGRSVLVLEPHDGIEEIQNLLGKHPVSTLGLASLRTLGDSQVEAMQNLLFLTNDGWRVVSATDTHAWDRREEDEWFDDEYTWPQTENAGARWDDDPSRSSGRIIDAAHRFASGW